MNWSTWSKSDYRTNVVSPTNLGPKQLNQAKKKNVGFEVYEIGKAMFKLFSRSFCLHGSGKVLG